MNGDLGRRPGPEGGWPEHPVTPWAAPDGGWPPPSEPAWPPPSPPPPGPWSPQPYGSTVPPWRRTRGRWAVPFLFLYAVLQGVRIGVATAHDPLSTTLGFDIGATALVLLIAFAATWRARRRLRQQSGPSDPLPIGRTRGPAAAGWAVGLATLAVVSSVLGRDLAVAHHRGIAGAPGYTTYGGPHGYPLAEGQPWGHPCQPLRFTVAADVSGPVYDQIAAVVRTARSDGVDVTIEDRRFMWYPTDLYPPGQDNATVQRIGIFVSSADPPRLSNGHLERIGFGWDAAVSPDGHHEHLTDLQATLYLSQLDGHPERIRTAVRQLVAFSQGVGGSTAAGSGISRGTTVDRFSSSDLHAMELMSGCNFEAAPPAPMVPGA